MFRRLFHRNIALLLAVVLAGQLLAGLLVMALVIRPQVTRVADITADMVSALSQAMESMAPDQRAAMIARVNAAGSMAIHPVREVPRDGPRFPTMLERQFTRALASRLDTQNELVWRTDHGGRLWFKLRMGSGDYWVSMTPPRAANAMSSLLLGLTVAFVIAVVCGLAIQRRIDGPLRRLARNVDGYRTDGTQPPLDVSGPEEVAAVAGALNRMTARLAGQEAERALMLAGVSHDLRTPLTRLRLSLEMLRGHDEELEATAIRQVDRIEAMLGQFLDFGRGFEAENREVVDVPALLRKMAADSGLSAEAVAAPEPLAFAMRPQAMARAVGNLLANAIRHGAAPIIISAARDGDRLRISVHDGGQGFDPAQADHILRPFARGDGARGGDGTGLGLAIAHRVALAHGGGITFARGPEGFRATIEIVESGG